MDTRRTHDDEINLKDLFFYIYKHRKFVIISTIVGFIIGSVVFAVSYFLNSYTELYSIKSTIAVTSQTESGVFTSNSSNPNSTDIHLAEDMVDSVIYVCTSDTVLNAATEELHLLGTKPEDIRKNLTVSQYKNTQIIQLDLIWYNEEEGIQILNAITHVLPDVLIDVLKLGSVSVINQPTSSSFFNLPVKPVHVALITLLFMLASAGCCIIEMFVHPTLTNIDDVGRILETETYGKIPNDPSVNGKRVLPADNESKASQALDEAYSSTAYTLSYQMKEKDQKIICFTSSTAQEGKTSIVANLGVQLSKQHSKVLLVDFDLRKPSLAGAFLENSDYDHSLNAILRKQIEPKDAIVTINPYLDILPTILEREPLWFSPVIPEIIKNLSGDYEFVLIDTAPVGQVSDTLFIKKVAKEVMYVVEYDNVWLSVIRNNLAKLKSAGFNIVGCIVSKVDKIGNEDMQYYHSYYSSQDSNETSEHKQKSKPGALIKRFRSKDNKINKNSET